MSQPIHVSDWDGLNRSFHEGLVPIGNFKDIIESPLKYCLVTTKLMMILKYFRSWFPINSLTSTEQNQTHDLCMRGGIYYIIGPIMY